jgi:dTMP kinase
VTESKAIFITLEGPDGAGKSSQIGRLAERLRALGHEVVATREPGGTTVGESVREVLMFSPAGSLDSVTDALLFNAARSRHVREVIGPALERGAVVICDRFGDSSRAYQGYGGGVPMDELNVVIRLATDGLVPNRTVLIDVSVEAGLARRQAGESGGLTRFETDDEAHGMAFHERVRAGYLEMAAAEPDRWRVVDGARDPEDVAEQIWGAVADLF